MHINFNRMQSSSSNDKERPTKRPRSKLSEGDEVEPVKSATASGVATRRFFSTENFNTKFQEDLSFPWRLYNLLQLEMFEDLVTWVPNGRAIKIVNEDRFTTEILPRFFPNMSNIKSFKRQLSAYNFSYIRSGKHAGACKSASSCFVIQLVWIAHPSHPSRRPSSLPYPLLNPTYLRSPQ